MVGAQLEGFDTMVHLTQENEFIILEGDEYLSSPIDMRPKFHLYKPNIALISGIAWDHINVFPTFENYVEQFRILQIRNSSGIMVYNRRGTSIQNRLLNLRNTQLKHVLTPTPEYFIDHGITHIDTPDGDMPLEIFGHHNLQNLAGAKWICQHIGIDEMIFMKQLPLLKEQASD